MLPEQEGAGAEEGRSRRLERNGAALHPQNGGEVVTAKDGGGERGHAGEKKSGLGVVSSNLELVDVAVSLQVIPRDKACCDVFRETPATNKRDDIGSSEDAANAVAAGVVHAEGGGVRGDHLQHVGWADAQGYDDPAPVVQVVVDGRCQGDAAYVHTQGHL